MPVVVLTGASGFLGAQAGLRLAAAGWTLRTTSTALLPPSWSSQHLDYDLAAAAANPGRLAGLMAGADAVVHLAAMASPAAAELDPGRCHRVNVLGTRQVLAAMATAGVGRLVVASSVMAYGPASSLPIREDHPLAAAAAYGRSKALAERACQEFAAMASVPVVALRLSNVAGPTASGDLGAGILPALVRAARSGEPLRIPTGYATADGTIERDFVAVADVVGAVVGALAWQDGFLAVNISTGTGTSIGQAAALVEALSGSPVTLVGRSPSPGEVPRITADPSLAASTLGWRPELSVTGILRGLLDVPLTSHQAA